MRKVIILIAMVALLCFTAVSVEADTGGRQLSGGSSTTCTVTTDMGNGSPMGPNGNVYEMVANEDGTQVLVNGDWTQGIYTWDPISRTYVGWIMTAMGPVDSKLYFSPNYQYYYEANPNSSPIMIRSTGTTVS